MKSRKLLRVSAVILLIIMSLFLTSCKKLVDLAKGIASATTTNAEEYVKGSQTDTSWESAYLNMRFDTPDEYYMATEEEIAEMVDFGGEVLYKDDAKEIIDYTKANSVYEMFCQSPGGLPNVSVYVEKSGNSTVEKYLELLESQLSSVPKMAYVFDEEPYANQLAGQDYTVLYATLTVNGIEMIQEYFVRQQGERMVGVIFTYSTLTQEDAQSVFDAFKPYN